IGGESAADPAANRRRAAASGRPGPDAAVEPLFLLGVLFAPVGFLVAFARRLRAQPGASRGRIGVTTLRAPEVERPGNRLGHYAFFEVGVGDREERVAARLRAELLPDRELTGDPLVSGFGRADAVERIARERA